MGSSTGFARIMKNAESHGICNLNFQAWKLGEGHEKAWESNMLSESKKAKI